MAAVRGPVLRRRWVRVEAWSFGADRGVLGGRTFREAYIDHRELESEASEGSYLD
jgi:hypothetical protein